MPIARSLIFRGSAVVEVSLDLSFPSMTCDSPTVTLLAASEPR